MKEHEHEFNEMMEESYEAQKNELAGQPDIPEQIMTPTDADVSEEWNLLRHPHGPQDYEELVEMDENTIKPYDDSKLREEHPEMNEKYWERRREDVLRKRTKPYEMVHQPTHYDFFNLAVIEVIKRTLSWEEYIGFLKGNSLKYRLRLGSKPNQPIYQELKKAKWYEEEYAKTIAENTPPDSSEEHH